MIDKESIEQSNYTISTSRSFNNYIYVILSSSWLTLNCRHQHSNVHHNKIQDEHHFYQYYFHDENVCIFCKKFIYKSSQIVVGCNQNDVVIQIARTTGTRVVDTKMQCFLFRFNLNQF